MDLPNLILFATEEAVEQATEPTFIGTLGLNWKLFLAQLLNFGIVFFILWRWVIKPVTGALEARRNKIEASVIQAEEIERRLKESDLEREAKIRQARAEAEEILKKTLAVSEESKRQSLAATRVERERMLNEAKSTIDSEKKKMLQEVREELATLTIMASEQILRSKLDKESDRKIIIHALDSLDSGKKGD